MSKPERPIPTPLFVRWQRVQYQLVPFLAVALGAAAAWRLWREAPRTTAVGQVDAEAVDVRSPTAGRIDDPTGGTEFPRLFDSVPNGQPLARIRAADGRMRDLIAPTGGQVVRIHLMPGQAVAEGQAVLTIAGDHGISITTYVRSEQRTRPEPGMAVDVRQRSDSAKTYRAVVERVGPQYVSVPAAQRRDQKLEEWGLPVVITVPQDANLKPGELVYIGWLPETSTGE